MTTAQLTDAAHRTVTSTVRKLPPEIRAHAERIPVHYERLPDESLLAEGFEPDILGLFTGTPFGGELREDQSLPPQILLYLENLWDFSDGDLEIFRDEVRLTYLHELGHFFGWDEEDLAARGLD